MRVTLTAPVSTAHLELSAADIVAFKYWYGNRLTPAHQVLNREVWDRGKDIAEDIVAIDGRILSETSGS